MLHNVVLTLIVQVLMLLWRARFCDHVTLFMASVKLLHKTKPRDVWGFVSGDYELNVFR